MLRGAYLDQSPRRGLEFRGMTWGRRGVPACGMRARALHISMMGAYFNDGRAGFAHFNDWRISQRWAHISILGARALHISMNYLGLALSDLE